MSKKMFFKKSSSALLVMLSTSVLAATNTAVQKEETWYDLSDPRAVYSSMTVGAGTEGVNISASYGGYLNGQYKQKITVEAMNDLEYYNVDYMLVNANTNSGFTLESTWDKDIWGIQDLNDSSVGVFAKVPLLKNKLNIYPKLNLGLLWGDEVDSTTYVKFDATTRYTFNRMFWVGVTPTYTYAMQGYELKEWETSLDAGLQLTAAFAVAGHVKHVDSENEYWMDVIFAF